MKKEEIDQYQGMSRQLVNKVKSDYEAFTSLLEQSSFLYKYPVTTILDIHSQYPSATFVADFDTWKRLNRFVKRGTKSIKLTHDREKIGHLFDVSQTGGADISFPDWRLSQTEKRELLGRFATTENETIGDVILNQLSKDEKKTDLSIEQLVAQKLVQVKLGMPFDMMEDSRLYDAYLSSIYNEQLSLIGTLEGALALTNSYLKEIQPILSEMRSPLYTFKYMIAPEPETQPETFGSTVEGVQLPEADELPELTIVEIDHSWNLLPEEQDITKIDDETYLVDGNGEPIPDEIETIHGPSANEFYRLKYRPIEPVLYLPYMDWTELDDEYDIQKVNGQFCLLHDGEIIHNEVIIRFHEQESYLEYRPITTDTDTYEVVDNQLRLKKAEKASPVETEEPPKISPEEITQALMIGSGTVDSKFRILQKYEKNDGLPEQVLFLKKEYGDGGTRPIPGTNHLCEEHDSSGLTIYDDERQLKLKWFQVATRIKKLIENEVYLTDHDRKLMSTPEEYVAKSVETTFNKNELYDCLLEGPGYPPSKARLYSTIKRGNLSENSLIDLVKAEYEISDRYRRSEKLTGFSSKYSTSELIHIKDGKETRDSWETITKHIIHLVESNRYVSEAEIRAFNLPVEEVATQEVSLFDVKELEDQSRSESSQNQGTMIPKELNDVTEGKVNEEKKTSLIETSQGYTFPEESIYPTKPSEKMQANLKALSLVKELEDAGVAAGPLEQGVLAKYVGWGGLFEIFDERTDKYSDERQELKALVSESDYSSMRDSVLTAYYTDPFIIKEMYKTLERFGFSSGKVLDPAMGTGNFFSAMPTSMRNGSELHGVELDGVTGKIAKHLHPDAMIQIKGFEETNFSSGEFDVVIGNIPFNQLTITDKKTSKDYRIHDYFIKQALELTRDGGVVALITSRYSLDKGASQERLELSKQAELLGAVRLPSSAFKKIAGTDVVTDILFFKKGSRPLLNSPEWVFTQMSKEYSEVGYNRYFHHNPEQILGDIEIKNFNGQTLSVKESESLSTLLPKGLSKIYGEFDEIARPTSEQQKAVEEHQSLESAIEYLESFPMYTYQIIQDDLYINTIDGVKHHTPGARTKERIVGMIGIRESLRAVIAIQQQTNYDPQNFDSLRQELTRVYDEFKRRFGYLNDTANQRAFSDDDSLPLLLSCEMKQEDGSYLKAEIFERPTIRPNKAIEDVQTAKESLDLSLAYTGKVDFSFMKQYYSQNEGEIINELGDFIFKNPVNQAWETRDEYLSGDVKGKLIMAENYAIDEPDIYARNVEALRNVQPDPLEAHEIEASLGATWIPHEVYMDFMVETFEISGNAVSFGAVKIDYNTFQSGWHVKGKSYGNSGSITTQQYGTKRVNALKIFEDCLNLKKTEVYDNVETMINGSLSKTREFNPRETILARAKQDQIIATFDTWLFSDSNRASEIVAIYNNRFNRYRPREYNGDYLIFDGLNQNFQHRPHQRNGIARIVSDGRGLLGHVVGAGKTLTMISAGMLMKAQGTIHKPMYVVPNHLINEFAQDILRFYPSKNVLITTKKDFETKNRKTFIARIASGNYDAVVIGHSQFEKIPLSKLRQEKMIKQELAEVANGIQELKDQEKKSWSFKQMLLFEKKLNERLDKLNDDSSKDQHLTFEETGVDFLFIDEAHNYKNLYTHTKLSNVAGVNSSHSKRASDMLMKVQYIQELHKGKGVVFATGTPISNSMSELFTMQRYLQPDILSQLGVTHFDAWASTFGEVVSSLEITPEGSGYQMKNRFAKFHNLPELMTVFSLVADIQTGDMLKLPVPDIVTGKAQVIVTEPTRDQELMMDEFADRAEQIRLRQVEPTEDNMLKLTHEAKLMAIDLRLLDDSFPFDETSKINRCCMNVAKIYHDSRESLSTQMIFSDSGTPKKDKFNVYDEIKRLLIEQGIPEQEIAFIHDVKTDVQRKELFAKVRTGAVSILLGSTSKVGTGTNVQDKLIALHHIDCPWRPSDLIQRDGRGVRQGNENKEISIFRYVTKGTFDAYLWQIQEQKLTYINQVMTGKSISRSCADLDETVLTAAEVKAVATKNPLLAEKMSIDNEVSRLRLLKGSWQTDKLANHKKITEVYPTEIKYSKRILNKIENDLSNQSHSDNFIIKLDGRVYDERQSAGEFLHALIGQSKMITGDCLVVGEYQGFKLTAKPAMMGAVVLEFNNHSTYKTELNLSSPLGSIRRIENIWSKVQTEFERESEQLTFYERELQKLEGKGDIPFIYEEKLLDLIEQQTELNLSIELNTKVEKASETKDNRKDVTPEKTRIIKKTQSKTQSSQSVLER